MRTNRPPILISLILVVVGIVLLLWNFLLVDIPELSPIRLWPILLIAIGVQVLWRGDIRFSNQAQAFGITRGNVQTAALEIGSGEVDVKIRALRPEREGRLIAGQFPARSRPSLAVRGGAAKLVMQRGQSWLLSLADWEIGLARDLPWQIAVTAWIGELDVDLRGLRVERLILGNGFGDVQIIAPDDQDTSALYGSSTFGNVTLVVPPNTAVAIQIDGSPFARVQIDETRFLLREPGLYATLEYDAHIQAGAQPVTAHLQTTFGTIRVA